MTRDWEKFKAYTEAQVQGMAREAEARVLAKFPTATRDWTPVGTKIAILLSETHGDLYYGHQRYATEEQMAWIDAAEKL